VQLSKLLRHGVAAGAAAGLCAALVLWVLVEPVIRRALEVEQARAGGHDGHAHEPLVSRSFQVLGGAVTAALVGVMVGVVFAVVFARTRHLLPGRSDVGRSAALATAGFLVVTLLPALKVPANPPAVGDPATVTERTLLYVLTVLLGVLGVGIVLAVDRWLRERGRPDPRRAVVDTLAAVVLAVTVLVLVPGSPDTVPGDVPPTLLWDFRIASLAQLATMWLVLGLVFGTLVQPRARARDTHPASA
jgi:predicted cobalt transporter CbtA